MSPVISTLGANIPYQSGKGLGQISAEKESYTRGVENARLQMQQQQIENARIERELIRQTQEESKIKEQLRYEENKVTEQLRYEKEQADTERTYQTEQMWKTRKYDENIIKENLQRVKEEEELKKENILTNLATASGMPSGVFPVKTLYKAPKTDVEAMQGIFDAQNITDVDIKDEILRKKSAGEALTVGEQAIYDEIIRKKPTLAPEEFGKREIAKREASREQDVVDLFEGSEKHIGYLETNKFYEEAVINKEGKMETPSKKAVEYSLSQYNEMRRSQELPELELIEKKEPLRWGRERSYWELQEKKSALKTKGGSSLPAGITEEDIKYTMDKYNLSREEVLKRIR